MAQTFTKVRSANHIEIKVDGQTVGLMQSVRCSDDYGLEPVSGVGSIKVVEHVPTVARHSLSISFAVLRRDLLLDMGFVPKNGEDALRGLVFDVEMFDRRDGQMVKKYTGCSYSSGDVSVDAHRIIVRNGQFMALDTDGNM